MAFLMAMLCFGLAACEPADSNSERSNPESPNSESSNASGDSDSTSKGIPGREPGSVPGSLPGGASETDDLESGPARLVLEASPIRGDAPLSVSFRARLVGDVEPGLVSDCPTLAWTLDSRDAGEIVLAQADSCSDEAPAREFQLEHSYPNARAYEVSLRIIGSDLAPSNLLQILVTGPTPTPAAQVAAAGPTIVIATPHERRPTDVPTPPPTVVNPGSSDADREDESTEDSEEISATVELPDAPDDRDAPEPLPTRIAERKRILPGDLYFLAMDEEAGPDDASALRSRKVMQVWRLPAEGGRAQVQTASDVDVQSFAVSTRGALAFSTAAGVFLQPEQAGASLLDENPGEALTWSRDGRRLAYQAASGELLLYELGRNAPRLNSVGDRPLAWSRKADWLLALDADGKLVGLEFSGAVDREPERVELPLTGVEAAGFLLDRDEAWLTGAGLRILRVEGDLGVETLIDADIPTRKAFGRPDGQIVLLSGDTEPAAVQLGLDDGEQKALGPALDALSSPKTDWAWAPDGRLAALSSPDALYLIDAASGIRVPLRIGESSQAVWVLRY